MKTRRNVGLKAQKNGWGDNLRSISNQHKKSIAIIILHMGHQDPVICSKILRIGLVTVRELLHVISTHHGYGFSFIGPVVGTFLSFSTTSNSQLFITLEAHPCHFHDLVSPNQGTLCNGRMGSALSAPLIGVIFPPYSTHMSVFSTELTISIMGPLLSNIQPFKIRK